MKKFFNMIASFFPGLWASAMGRGDSRGLTLNEIKQRVDETDTMFSSIMDRIMPEETPYGDAVASGRMYVGITDDEVYKPKPKKPTSKTVTPKKPISKKPLAAKKPLATKKPARAKADK